MQPVQQHIPLAMFTQWTIETLALTATCEQRLLSTATGGFFGQQDFREAYRVPTVQEGHAQCNETLPTLKEKTQSSFTKVCGEPLPPAPPTFRCSDANFFVVLLSILSSLCSYCFVCAFVCLGEFQEYHLLSGLSHSLHYGEWLTNKITIVSWLNSSTSL